MIEYFTGHCIPVMPADQELLLPEPGPSEGRGILEEKYAPGVPDNDGVVAVFIVDLPLP